MYAGKSGGIGHGRVTLAAAAVLLAGALVFGGGSRGAGDFVVHLLAAPALAIAILQWRHAQASRAQRMFLYLLCAAASLLVLQLLPLPRGLFDSLHGRDGVLQELGEAGVRDAWLALSLNPLGTLRALLALLVFATAWMLASMLPPHGREQLLRLVLAIALLMALLGFAQAAAGRHSALRFYDFHHPVGAIGAFSNRNHFADLMAMMIPFAVSMGKVQFERNRAGAGLLLWSALTVVLFLAAALSFSRTGFALACAALVAGWLVQLRGKGEGVVNGGATRWALPLAVAGSCVLAVAYYAWRGIVQRLDQDPLDDLRWQYLSNGLQVVRAQLPWGSGFGSFRDVYAPFEPVADMGRTFAMHAHNDALEIAIEGGVPALILLCATVVMIAWAAASLWRGSSARSRLKTAAAVAVFVPLVHSFVDYPLRTLAVASVFGLVMAVLLAPPQRQPDVQEGC
jgi:O-antigen ligase